MTSEQTSKLDAYLAGHNADDFAGVAEYSSDRESILFAKKLKTIFANRKWVSQAGTTPVLDPDPIFGLAIEINPEDKSRPPIAANQMRRFFNEDLHLPVRAVASDVVPKGKYELYVGPKDGK